MLKKIQKGFTAIELIIILQLVGSSGLVFSSRYNDYIIKKQVTRVIAESGSIKTSVEACINEGITILGTNNDQCDPGATASSLQDNEQKSQIHSITGNGGFPQVSMFVSEEGIQATIATRFGIGKNGKAHHILKDHGIIWSRDVDGNWSCQMGVINLSTSSEVLSTVSPASLKVFKYAFLHCPSPSPE